MNTENLIVHTIATSHSFTDENSYFQVKFQKKYRTNWWKVKTTRHRKYTITRTITYEQHSFWRNSL